MACAGCLRARKQLLAARTPAAAGQAVSAALAVNLAKAKEAWRQAQQERLAAANQEKRDG